MAKFKDRSTRFTSRIGHFVYNDTGKLLAREVKKKPPKKANTTEFDNRNNDGR